VKDEPGPRIRREQRIAAWLVHLFTATGGVIGLLALYAIHHERFLWAFWLMAATIVIDAVDGVLARLTKVAVIVPNIDGALLDNLVDYLNYVIVPAFFILVADLVPSGTNWLVAGLIVLSSAYQFSQKDAKTEDHFFKGFPSYWNFCIFYLFLWQTGAWFNLIALSILVVMVFVPVKYAYPSRPEYLFARRWLRHLFLTLTFLYGIISMALLWIYPATSSSLVGASMAYLLTYFLVSLYRTFHPVHIEADRYQH
jgi:phosphatidylcholine synthase